jgi:hypothetical protein
MGRPYLVSALCSISKPMPRGKTSMLEVRDSGGTSYHVRANAGPAAVLTREWPLSPRPPTCRHLVTTESMRAPKIPQASWVGRGGAVAGRVSRPGELWRTVIIQKYQMPAIWQFSCTRT